MPSERDDSDPNKNDKGDSYDNNTTNDVICSDNEQGDSKLTKEGSDGSANKEDGIAYKEMWTAETGVFKRQMHVRTTYRMTAGKNS